MIILSIILFVTAISLFVYMVKKAPMGYEDEQGFHYGREE